MKTFATPIRRTPARRPMSPAPQSLAETAAVRRILHSPRPQAKLTVGAPDDAFEKEADEVAGEVMRMPGPGVQRMCAECEEEEKEKIQARFSGERPEIAHELTHVVQQGGGAARVQRAVSFRADFSDISVTPQAAAAISGSDFTYDDASFSANANVTAIGDTEAELDEWDVGVLQDMVVNWEREYWQRENADRRGRFVEQKFRPINTRFRDQLDNATTVWSADDEHQDLSPLAKTPSGSRFEVSTTINTTDDPSGSDTIHGSSVTGMDASDGLRNIDIQRIGSRFDTWISAHNTVTGDWRHLRRLNWNYMRSLDFTGSGGTLAVGPESGQVGHHGPYGAGRAAPLTPDTAATTANDAMGDDANWTRRRVNGWT